MKYYVTIMNDAEEAYSLTWKDVYNIVHCEKAGYKIVFLETNFMTNTKQLFNKYCWVAKQ